MRVCALGRSIRFRETRRPGTADAPGQREIDMILQPVEALP